MKTPQWDIPGLEEYLNKLDDTTIRKELIRI